MNASKSEAFHCFDTLRFSLFFFFFFFNFSICPSEKFKTCPPVCSCLLCVCLRVCVSVCGLNSLPAGFFFSPERQTWKTKQTSTFFFFFCHLRNCSGLADVGAPLSALQSHTSEALTTSSSPQAFSTITNNSLSLFRLLCLAFKTLPTQTAFPPRPSPPLPPSPPSSRAPST